MMRWIVVVLALAIPAGAEQRWDPVEIPSDVKGYEHAASYLLDAAAAEVPEAELRRAWRRHERLVKTLCRAVERWNHTSAGSWNHGPNACAAWIAVTGDGRPSRVLEGYAIAQLRGPPEGHGLMGREVLSHRYLDTTLVALEMAADRTDREETRAALHRLLRAHAYSLALFAVAGGPSGERVSIIAPGARSKVGTETAPWLSRWLAGVIYGPERPTLGWGRQWAWPLRATWALGSKGWLSPADRALLRRHVDTGAEAAAIVDTLQELDGAFVVDVEVVRTEAGIGAWMERNPNGNTAPLMAASLVGGRFHALHLIPGRKQDSGGPRSLGVCRAVVDELAVGASCVGAVGHGPPLPGTRWDEATATYSGAIPLPTGPELYRVRVGPAGGRLVVGEAPVEPSPESPRGSLSDLELAARIYHAWASPQIRLEDVPPPRDLDRVRAMIELLRGGG